MSSDLSSALGTGRGVIDAASSPTVLKIVDGAISGAGIGGATGTGNSYERPTVKRLVNGGAPSRGGAAAGSGSLGVAWKPAGADSRGGSCRTADVEIPSSSGELVVATAVGGSSSANELSP